MKINEVLFEERYSGQLELCTVIYYLQVS